MTCTRLPQVHCGLSVVRHVLGAEPMQLWGDPPHVLPAQQDWPWAPHGWQAPDRQTPVAPHAVPSPTLVPVSLHCGVPVEQSVAPVWQALAGVHEAPCVHAVHVPLWQTWFAPHDIPFGTLPDAVQTGC